jgi:hypothetical protein
MTSHFLRYRLLEAFKAFDAIECQKPERMDRVRKGRIKICQPGECDWRSVLLSYNGQQYDNIRPLVQGRLDPRNRSAQSIRVIDPRK